MPATATSCDENPGPALRCEWCGHPLRGQQTMFCGAPCKAKAHCFRQSMDHLASLPEADFRELLRGVCQQRYFTPWKRGGRLHIRWGEYQENKEDLATREARLSAWKLADRQVRRAENGRHLYHGWAAQGLSWVAQYLRLLDRAAKAGRGRGEREGSG